MNVKIKKESRWKVFNSKRRKQVEEAGDIVYATAHSDGMRLHKVPAFHIMFPGFCLDSLPLDISHEYMHFIVQKLQGDRTSFKMDGQDIHDDYDRKKYGNSILSRLGKEGYLG